MRDGSARLLEREPTAVVCTSDALAIALTGVVQHRGLLVPRDVSVVGFGDFSPATQITPQLTTVRIHGAEMGAIALRLLLERIEGRRPPDVPARRVMIACRIVERRSTGPCRAAARRKAVRG